MYYLTSNSMRMMERSLDYLWAKQTAHMDNISNAETPGYKVKTVSFEELFAAKLHAAARGERAKTMIRHVIEDSRWSVDEDDEITRMDENGVNVLEQLVEASRTAYQLQYTMQSISGDLTILGKAIHS